MILPPIDIFPMPILSVASGRPYVVITKHGDGTPANPHRGVSLAVWRGMQSKQVRVPGYVKPNIRKKFRK